MNVTRLLASILISSLIIIAGCTGKKEPVRVIDNSFKEVIKETRRDALFYMVRSFTPGSSLAVSVKGNLVYSEGFGHASTDLEVPATRETRYRIGGITQVLTALAYYKLIDEGKIAPDDMVWKHLPEFPEKKFPLKLQNLVDHTSGIRLPTDEELSWRGINTSLRKGIENFSNDSLLYPPGSFQYPTIFNYNLLGAVLEEVTQEPFSKLIRELVTDTLQMSQTLPDNPLITIKNRTNFYDRDMVAQVVNATFRDFRWRIPSEGYLSTAEDLVKLGNALLYGTNLQNDIRDKMLSAPETNEGKKQQSGNGIFFLQTLDGRPFFAAKGNVTGGGSMLIIYPEDEIVVAWAANLDDGLDELPGLNVANNFRDFINGTFKTREEKQKEAAKEYEKD